MAIHHAVVEIFKVRFPELETLVPSALDYLKLVTRIQNETVSLWSGPHSIGYEQCENG